MMQQVLLCLLFVLSLAFCKENIAFGERAALGELGHQVAVVSMTDKSSFCGGTIIGKNIVISAAHCFDEKASSAGVIAGRVDLNGAQGVVRKISKIVAHEQYDSATIANDIAVVFLESDIAESPTIKYATLSQVPPVKGTNYIVSGFGLTEKGETSPYLLKVSVPVTDNANCQIDAAFANVKFCAADGTGKDACQGDSGGPFGRFQTSGNSTTFVLYGVVSFGPQSCGARGEAFGGYVTVASFSQWINNAIAGKAGKQVVFTGAASTSSMVSLLLLLVLFVIQLL